MLKFVCKSNEGDGSGNGCVKKAEKKISFFVWSPSPLTSLTFSVNQLNGSGEGDKTIQPIKMLENMSSQTLFGDSTPNLASVSVSASVSFI